GEGGMMADHKNRATSCKSAPIPINDRRGLVRCWRLDMATRASLSEEAARETLPSRWYVGAGVQSAEPTPPIVIKISPAAFKHVDNTAIYPSFGCGRLHYDS